MILETEDSTRHFSLLWEYQTNVVSSLKSELTNLGFSLPAILDKLAAFLESYKGIIIWCHLNSNMSTSYIFSGIESGSPATAHPE